MAPNFVTKDPTEIRIPSWEFVVHRFSMVNQNSGCKKFKNYRTIEIILTRWPKTEDTACCQHGTENVVPR